MATYRSFGKLDDVHVSDGDRGFQRMIGRVNPELLEPGNVYYSQNGRMDQDMCWRPRKGMTVFYRSQQIQIVDTILPFDLDDDGNPPQLNDNAVTGVYGTGSFVDLSTEQEYFIIALNNRAIAKPLDGSAAEYNIAYPIGTSLSENVEFAMVNDKVILFRDNARGLEFDTDLAANIVITAASRSSNNVTFTTNITHPLSVNDVVGIFNVQNLDDWADGTYTVTAVTSNTFTVAQSGGDDSTNDPGAAIATRNLFSEVAAGAGGFTDYTAISVDTDVNMDVSEGVCTVEATGHGRSTGDIVQVYASNHNELTVGDRYEIVVIDANTYKFNANVPDGNNFVVTLGGKQPVSGGFIHLPDPPWGVYHEGRLIVPYRRNKTIGNNIDELVFSDIFDTDTYDPIINQLRFGSGSADRIVGISPFISDRLLVFCRRSIHVVNGISGELEDLTKFEVTREVGCLARKSIVPVGNQVLWLSDQGVYSVSYGAELNLMANNVPLSEPIEPWIRLINWDEADKAVAAYHENRYYLAVPTGQSVYPNIIFVYNFLNQGWESIDTLPDNFELRDMFTVRYNNKETLFLANETGGVHIYETQRASDSFSVGGSGTITNDIIGKLVTRRYTFNVSDIKKFSRGVFKAENIEDSFAEFLPEGLFNNSSLGTSPVGTLKISANIKEPDNIFQLGTTEYPNGYEIGNPADDLIIGSGSPEDSLIKASINKRGYGLQYVFETSDVKVRSAQADAFILGRSTTIRS